MFEENNVCDAAASYISGTEVHSPGSVG